MVRAVHERQHTAASLQADHERRRDQIEENVMANPRVFPASSIRASRNKCLTELFVACALLIAMGMMMSTAAQAQAVYGSIFGTVADKTGAAVPGATVTVTDISKGTSVSTHTNASGDYRVDHLIPDAYSVKVAMKGFQVSTVPKVTVYADTAPKVDVQLQVGSATQTVTVHGGSPLLQTDRTDVNTVLNQRAVRNLPNLDRNLTAFELLTPGTTYIGWNVGQATNPQESEQIEVNGQLPFATGYQLDGTDNQDPVQGIEVINPNLDAISQVKVTSQDYDAEFGNSVAGLVTAQTKSGSNHFHGTAFEYRRSDAQQARDPFTQYAKDPLTGRYIPSFLHNQFGGSIGGPIKKDKVFFFGDYQGLRERTGQTVLTTVPTALAHDSCTSGGNCNLSDYINPNNPFFAGTGAQTAASEYQAYDPGNNASQPVSPSSRTAFAGNIIPASRLSAPAVNLMKEMPLPNNGNSISDNYVASGSGGFNTDQWDVRVDDQVTSKFHSFVRYTHFDSNLQGNPVFGAAGGPGFGAGGFAGTDTALDQSIAAGGDIALSSNWMTDFRFGWFRIGLNEEGPGYNQPLGTQLGIPNINQSPVSLTGGLPQFNIAVPSNGANGSSSVTYGTSANKYVQQEAQYQFVNNWTHFAGNHTIKFGADVRYALNHLVGVNNNNLLSGQFGFTGNTTQGGTGAGASSGLGWATFLLGDTSSFVRTEIANTNARERQRRMFFYGQDTWRATHNLTIDYGLRWDLLFPETVNGKGNGGLTNLRTGNVQIAGYGNYGMNAGVSMEYTHLAPRIGIAWQALPHTVFRAGYGREYGMGWSGDTFGEVLTFSYPTAIQQNPVSSAAYGWVFNLAQGPPNFKFPSIPASGNFPLPDGIQEPTRPLTMRIPTLDSWNVAIQQQLTRSSSLQISYVGSHGIHNMFDSSNQADPNQPTLNGFNCLAVGSCGASQVPIDPATGKPYTQNERRPYYDGTAQKYLSVNFGVPHGWTQSFRYNANEATTRYDALQVVFEKRFSHGLQVMANYTWSSARANESDYFFNNHRADWGNSYYNRRHVFVASGTYELPIGHGKAFFSGMPGWANEIFGGYTINAVVTSETGLPFTPSYALCAQDQDIDGQGGTLCRPSAAGPNANYGTKAQSFDPASHTERYFNEVPLLASNGQREGPYVRPQSGTFGNIERNSLWGPGLFNTDMNLSKEFSLTHGVSMQMLVQAYNLFNHPNLAQPNGCVDCGGNGGNITDVIAAQLGSSMRGLQFATRIEF
jgi:hypothetical protein